MSETAVAVFILVAAPLIIIAVVSWILHYFIALTSPPMRRAVWTVGVSYIVAAAFWLFGGPEGDRWEGPFVAVPGALIAFWWWKTEFETAWIDDRHGIPDGIKLANDNWKVGLLGVAGVIFTAAIKMFFLRNVVGH